MDPIFPPVRSDGLVGQVLPRGLRVLEEAGRTALGPLYRAQFPEGPPVALVVLDPPASPRDPAAAAAAARVAEQLRRASRIRHPNVAGLMEVGDAPDGRTYAVAEFLTGRLLSDLLAERGALPAQEAVDICLQAAAGLNAAHQLGIVHGEVSPRTMLVARADDGRQLVKLVCFNLDPGAGPGRPARSGVDARYSSPERLAGGAPDQTADVFSLGAVLHHLLTGAAPPAGRAARRSLPKALARVVDRALAPSPERRYPTVASFAEALADAVKVFRRPRRWPSRRPRLVGGIGVVAVLLAVGIWLGWTRYQARGGARAEQEVGMEASERVEPAPAQPPSAQPPSAQPPPPQSRPAQPPPASAPAGASPRRPAPADSVPRVALSPFRRAHPWAADPEGRFYFPSSCPLALRARELLYFRSEAEAQATGRSRSTAPGCS